MDQSSPAARPTSIEAGSSSHNHNRNSVSFRNYDYDYDYDYDWLKRLAKVACFAEQPSDLTCLSLFPQIRIKSFGSNYFFPLLLQLHDQCLGLQLP